MWSLIPWKKSGAGGTLAVEPFEREFNRIRSEFDSLFNRLWSGIGVPAFADDWASRFGWGPDMEETDTHYVVRIAAPGFEVEDFDVHISGNQLVVKAEHKESKEGNGRSSYRFGRVQQMLPLPEGAEVDQIEANYHAGVLELKIPKGKETQAKRITVKAG